VWCDHSSSPRPPHRCSLLERTLDPRRKLVRIEPVERERDVCGWLAENVDDRYPAGSFEAGNRVVGDRFICRRDEPCGGDDAPPPVVRISEGEERDGPVVEGTLRPRRAHGEPEVKHLLDRVVAVRDRHAVWGVVAVSRERDHAGAGTLEELVTLVVVHANCVMLGHAELFAPAIYVVDHPTAKYIV
jgi:hypothetical protein